MGRAYTCDRCGKLFKKEDWADKVSVILENGNPFGIDFGNTQLYISLCPKCRAEFQKWWDEGAYCKTTEHQCVKTLYEEDEEKSYAHIKDTTYKEEEAKNENSI